MLGVIQYGIGNPRSILNMLDYIGIDSKLISKPDEVLFVDKLIFPGVGNFDACVTTFSAQGFDIATREFVKTGKPVLGICVGSQMLGHFSEEGKQIGLGLLNLNSVRFDGSDLRPIPRMEWGEVLYTENNAFSKKMRQLGTQKYYFSHSFYHKVNETNLEIALTNYGIEYACVVGKDNILGVQFHPEKSHKFGMNLFKNFNEWNP